MIYGSWVCVLAGQHCVVALGKLLTPVCFAHQALEFGTGQEGISLAGKVTAGMVESNGSLLVSVCPSVYLSHTWIVTKLNDTLQIFLYHTKGESLCYSDTKSGWWATPPSL